MSSPSSDHNPKTMTLDAATERENLNYISKFGLPANVAHHIDSRLILHDVHIDDPTIASDVELNSRVLNCLESYQLSPSLVVDLMLEVFREEFQGWGYMEFSKLDRHIRGALKETFMAKGIYMGRPSDHVNQRLANLVIDEQLPIWDENDLRKYKKIYPTSKAWILLESEFDSPVPQQLTPSIEPKINPIDNRRQQSFIPGPEIHPVQAPPTPAHPIQIPTAQVLPIQVSLAQVLSIPAATIQTPLSVRAAPSPPAEHGHKQPEMHPKQVKIVSDKLETFTANKYADAQLSASGQKEIQGLLEKDDFKVVTSDKLVMPKKVQSSTQVFNSHFVNNIKDPYTDKAYEKSRLVMHTYNDKMKNLMLMHSPKIPRVSQGIGSCLTAIIGDNDNDNIRFYLRNITQAYIEIASNLNLDFYIRPLSKLISQLSA